MIVKALIFTRFVKCMYLLWISYLILKCNELSSIFLVQIAGVFSHMFHFFSARRLSLYDEGTKWNIIKVQV